MVHHHTAHSTAAAASHRQQRLWRHHTILLLGYVIRGIPAKYDRPTNFPLFLLRYCRIWNGTGSPRPYSTKNNSLPGQGECLLEQNHAIQKFAQLWLFDRPTIDYSFDHYWNGNPIRMYNLHASCMLSWSQWFSNERSNIRFRCLSSFRRNLRSL